MNSFFAVSLDIDDQREHIIYCSDSIEAFYTNQTDNVFKIERPLGEFIFDFSGLQEQERYNAVTEYLSNFPEHNSAHILTEIFFEAQRHLSFLPLKNDKNRFSTYEVLKICLCSFFGVVYSELGCGNIHGVFLPPSVYIHTRRREEFGTVGIHS